MVGTTAEEAVDVRIISATHKNLSEMMDHGLFRQDLYYRLNVIQLKMPALRDRASDIPALANVLLAKLCANQNCAMPEVDTEALAYISSLAFPGNVRELENMLERALALCDGNLITVDDLFIENALKQEIRRKPFEATPLGTLNLSDYLEDVEKKAIIQALRHSA